MKKFRNHTLQEYLNALAAREPIPGGGSAAALAAALGVGLVSMVSRYSLGKGSPASVESRLKRILQESEKIRTRFLQLVDIDAQAYLGVVRSRKGPRASQESALRKAAQVPREVCQLCRRAMDLTPFLVVKGNKWLLSDIEVAIELLAAAHASAKTLTHQG